jgi:hypothetical protein
MTSLSGHGLALMEGVVCQRPLCLDKKAHLRKHVGADAGDHVRPDIQVSAGSECRSGGRQSEAHLHFDFRSNGNTSRHCWR